MVNKAVLFIYFLPPSLFHPPSSRSSSPTSSASIILDLLLNMCGNLLVFSELQFLAINIWWPVLETWHNTRLPWVPPSGIEHWEFMGSPKIMWGESHLQWCSPQSWVWEGSLSWVSQGQDHGDSGLPLAGMQRNCWALYQLKSHYTVSPKFLIWVFWSRLLGLHHHLLPIGVFVK